jgi:hypothetical protein
LNIRQPQRAIAESRQGGFSAAVKWIETPIGKHHARESAAATLISIFICIVMHSRTMKAAAQNALSPCRPMMRHAFWVSTH